MNNVKFKNMAYYKTLHPNIEPIIYFTSYMFDVITARISK